MTWSVAVSVYVFVRPLELLMNSVGMKTPVLKEPSAASGVYPPRLPSG